MIRIILVVAFMLGLPGCVSVGGFHLPDFGRKPASAAPVATGAPSKPVCSAAITADTKPMPQIPDGASVPAAQTPEASAGLSVYLVWLHSLADWGKEGWARVGQAQQDCASDH